MSIYYGAQNFHNFEPDALKNVIDNEDAEFRVLGDGPQNVSLWQLELGDIAIDSVRFQFPVFFKCAVPRDRVLIGLEMMDSTEVFINNCWSSTTAIELYAPGSDFQCLSRNGGQPVGILLSPERLQTSAISMGYKEVDWPSHGIRSIHQDTKTIQSIRREIWHLIKLGKQLSQIDDELLVSNLFTEGLTQLLARAISEPHSPQNHGRGISRCRQHTLEVFESYIDDLLEHPEIKPGFRNIPGITQRMLERAAREIYGVTPNYWLRLARLNGAYKELLRGPNTSIMDLAQRWGFGHAGRFSRFYYEIFGEYPSETSQRLQS